MADPKFLVVFDGRLMDGADPARVKADLAQVFKTDVATVAPMFSGRRTVIKRGLDEATARRYQAVLERAGAVVALVEETSEVRDAGPAQAEPPAPPQRAEPPGVGPAPRRPAAAAQEGPTPAQIAEAGRAPPPIAARATPSAPEDMSMAEAGALLVDDPARVAAPDIDTSHLSLADPGADLVEREKVAAPEFDLSRFELAPPGTPMGGEDAASRK